VIFVDEPNEPARVHVYQDVILGHKEAEFFARKARERYAAKTSGTVAV